MEARKALFAGSFDPLTKGHVDLIERGVQLFDRVYVAVATNLAKHALFSPEEKLELIEEALEGIERVEIIQLEEGLTVDLARKLGCQALLRGVRNGQDFEYEQNMAAINRLQDPDLETVLLCARDQYRSISSTMIREMAKFGGDISAWVPENVNQAMKEKYAKK